MSDPTSSVLQQYKIKSGLQGWGFLDQRTSPTATICPMIRSELIDALRERFPHLTPKDVDQCVKAILDAMTSALTHNDRIEIRGFGSFRLNFRPPRVGHNPMTGVKVLVPAKYVPHFKPGLELRKSVDRPR